MKDIKEKIRILYIPYLLTAIGFIGVYSLLNWLLFLKLQILPLREDLVQYWLPFILSFIVVYIFLRPRIKLLAFKDDNGSFGFQFVAALSIAIPTIIAQQYLNTSTGELTRLFSIKQYERKEVTKYYQLQQYYLDKKQSGILYDATVSGKHNRDLNLRVYVALPILNKATDSIKGECSYFLGIRYAKTISNSLSIAEKEAAFKQFKETSLRNFEAKRFDHFIYLEKLGVNENRDKFGEALTRSNYVRYADPVIFEAHYEPFENRNGNTFGWIFGSFGIGTLVWLVFILIPKFHQPHLKKFKKGIKPKDNSLKEVFDFLIPKEGYTVTPILLNLNLLVFLFMVLSGLGFVSFDGKDLLDWGANYRPYTQNDGWWRLLTCTFLHGGLMHLLVNMFGLVYIGLLLEPFLGTKKFITGYFITGLLGSLASIWWYPATVSVGASGAIFGLYGIFLALLLLKVFPKEFSHIFLGITAIFVGYNLIMGFAGGIDNAAHIGGLLSGLMFGYIWAPSVKEKITVGWEEEDNLVE